MQQAIYSEEIDREQQKHSLYGDTLSRSNSTQDERGTPSVVDTTLYSPNSSLTEDTGSVCSSPDLSVDEVVSPPSLNSSDGLVNNVRVSSSEAERIVEAIAQLHHIMNRDDDETDNDCDALNGAQRNRNRDRHYHIDTQHHEETQDGSSESLVPVSALGLPLPACPPPSLEGSARVRDGVVDTLIPIQELPPSLEVIESYKLHGSQEKFLFTLSCYKLHKESIQSLMEQNNTPENNCLLKYITIEYNYLEEFYRSFQYQSTTSITSTTTTTTSTTDTTASTNVSIDTAHTTDTIKTTTTIKTDSIIGTTTTDTATSVIQQVDESFSTTVAATPNTDSRSTDDNLEMGISAASLDESDKDDPQCVIDYVGDIFVYFGQKEIAQRVTPGFMSIQTDINEKMRAILIDWMIDVQHSLKLLPETLYLSINVLDHFLSIHPIRREQLQLVGISCMVIACKYEEIFPPECNDFIYISDNVTTHNHILHMERTILTTLHFSLTFVSPLDFLRRYSRLANSNYTVHSLCKYLLETMLLDVNMAYYLPSMLAAAAVYLARAMVGVKPEWTPGLESVTGYEGGEVRKCALYLNSFVKMVVGSTLKTVKKKYSASKYGKVALIEMVTLKE